MSAVNCQDLGGQSKRAILVSIMLIALFLQSCSAKRLATTEVTTKVEVLEITRDTIVTVLPDSALIRAYLECQQGRVALSRLISLPGARIVPDLTLTQVNESESLLTFRCREDSLRIELQLRDKLIRELHENKATETVIEVRDTPLKWWQKGLMACGACFIVLCLVGIIRVLK